MSERRVLRLQEHRPKYAAAGEIAEEEALYIYRELEGQVSVEPPSFRTENRWKLVSHGWVGCLPVSPDLELRLRPKVEIGNLFRMLEYAYGLKSFRFLEGLTEVRDVDDIYDRLAAVLAKRVLSRARRGFYRAYLGQTERLQYVRGTLNLAAQLRKPWEVGLRCQFEEHTADVEENQILAWTLRRVALGGRLRDETRRLVLSAGRTVGSFATPTPFRARDCANRLYDRLNDDYEPMHALCRFFLENTGPAHEGTENKALPFMVFMPALYEQFVAEWLRVHSPSDWRIEVQKKLAISPSTGLTFRPDILIWDADSEQPLAVVDTKYKGSDGLATDDVAQVVAYAEAVGCRKAYLVYPAPLVSALADVIGDVDCRSVTFAVEGDLEKNGADWVAEMTAG